MKGQTAAAMMQAHGLHCIVTAYFAVTMGLTHAEQKEQTDCIYAATSGSNRGSVAFCGDSDPLNLRHDPKIIRAMAALGIDAARVRFIGCSNESFRVRQDTQANGDLAYVIFYPSEANNLYLAPTIHELAHVMQMDSAGGLKKLYEHFKEDASRRIELGADFLTGALFRSTFPDAEMKEFQQNKALRAQYIEETSNPHGKPEQRDAAFSLGINKEFGPADQDIERIYDIFQKKLYGQVLYFSQ